MTNAIDATLDERAASAGNVQPPESPRTAAQQWFGRPISGPDTGLFKWDYLSKGHDRHVSVTMLNSSVVGAPTIDVIDDGVGIAPSEFPSTILSLQAGNKIRKRYLVGAFGQGGASTLAFCDYAIVVSRSATNQRVIGFTVIRVVKLDASYKEDCFAYLCQRDSAGQLTVPSCQLDGPLQIYDVEEKLRTPKLARGTLVRHVAFKLPSLDKGLSSSPGNLYHFLHASLFDPLLPFRLIDLRDDSKARNELVTGSRNRLMKRVESRGESDTEEHDKGTSIRHHRPMEYVYPHGSSDPSIGIEYWVVFNYRKGKSATEPPHLRGDSNELFVERGIPVIGTLNGQNQGDMRAKIARDCGLSMVSHHLVVHIDATNVDSRVRRELFATNREGFKEGHVFDGVVQSLKAMLEEDEELLVIERELTEKLTKRESQTTKDEVKRLVTQLLLEAGMHQKEEGPSIEPGKGDVQPTASKRTGQHRKLDPLPTLPFPQVTYLTIKSPKDCLKVHVGSFGMVLVETDADSEFDKRGLVAIRTEPDCFELATKSALVGGRIRWRLRPKMTSKPGDRGKVIVALTRPDGTQLTSNVGFEVLPPEELPAKKSRGTIPPFEIIPINPIDDQDKWEFVWPNLNETSSTSDLEAVAYKPVQAGGGITVYYSTVFGPFKAQVEKLKQQSPSTVEMFTTEYEVWVGYHAILQEQDNANDSMEMDSEMLDRVRENERILVGRMQVKQAIQTVELRKRNLQSVDHE